MSGDETFHDAIQLTESINEPPSSPISRKNAIRKNSASSINKTNTPLRMNTRSDSNACLDVRASAQGNNSENDDHFKSDVRLSNFQKSENINLHPLSTLSPQKEFLDPEQMNYCESESENESSHGQLAESKSSFGAASVSLSVAEDGIPLKPKLIRVGVKKKGLSEFSHLHLIQTLEMKNANGQKDLRNLGLYTGKFSRDGTYYAAAGASNVICIWKILAEEVLSIKQIDPEYDPPKTMSVFQTDPTQIFVGHENDILDLSWSKNNFLLSCSIDKTVRLWHFTRSDCLGIFRHPDIVTSVCFHPRNDRIFISGSLDCRIRLWSIADQAVKSWNELPERNFITAVSFTNSGKYAIAGTLTGICLFFETINFTYLTQIHVHSTKGKNKIGHKICGIEPMPGKREEDLILISTNDSRIRLYTLKDKSLKVKFQGHVNSSSQIRASFSDDCEHVIAGSEDGKVFIWSVENRHYKSGFFSRSSEHRIKSYEYFGSHSKSVIEATFAPSSLKHKLQTSGLRPINTGDIFNGQIVAAVDLNGKIRIYENNSKLVDWLASRH